MEVKAALADARDQAVRKGVVVHVLYRDSSSELSISSAGTGDRVPTELDDPDIEKVVVVKGHNLQSTPIDTE